jgi:hypothetical protein
MNDDYSNAIVVKDNIINNIKCGLHSGFPWCCIAFYVLFWNPFFYIKDFTNTRVYKNLHARYTKLGFHMSLKRGLWRLDKQGNILSAGFGRVVCPFCLFFSTKTGSNNCGCFFGTPEQLEQNKHNAAQVD